MSAGPFPDPSQDPNGGATAPDPQQQLAAVLANPATAAQVGPPTIPTNVAEAMDELIGAVTACASAARSAADTREQQELGAAALAFSQAWVIMHPNLASPQGVSPDKLHPPAGDGYTPRGAGTTTGRPPQPTARRDGTVKG